jgi:hypothetical protein
MLPGIRSYFISDGSILWKPMAFLSNGVSGLRWEHQLFIGISAVILLTSGLVWQFKSVNRKMAFLFIGAAAFLVFITLDVNGFSIYKIFWALPGFNSIRAVTRIILLLMWPIALFISIEVDALLKIPSKGVLPPMVTVLFLGLMMSESVFYQHATFTKAEADDRLQKLYEEIPSNLPQNPVLFVWNPEDDTGYLTELDAMLLSQELGWPVMNGYSGNIPGGYGASTDCAQVVDRIKRYMIFSSISDPNFYQNLISRIVAIGPEVCQWPKELP